VIVGGGGVRIRVAVVCFVCGDPAYRDTLVCVIVRMWVCIIVWVEWLCGCVRMRGCIIVCVLVCVWHDVCCVMCVCIRDCVCWILVVGSRALG